MNRSLAALALLLALAACASSPPEPSPNLSILKGDCVAWHDSGAYAEAFARATEPAANALEGYLHGVTPQNFAVVFDIDETLLSNWPYLSAAQFAIQPDTFADWARTGRGIPLAPMQAVYAKAHAYQIPIFLITGRRENLRDATIRDLQAAGYWGWRDLFMRPDNDGQPSVVPFKSGVRQLLTQQGWDLILNVGDQDSDLEGGYARHRVKLPNPFYYLP